MQDFLTRVGVGSAINLALLLPLIAAAFLTTGRRVPAVKPVLLFAALFVLDEACIWLFKAVQLIPAWGGYNWQGKVLEIAWPLLLALTVPTFSAKRIGLTLPEQGRSWRDLLIVCVLYLAVGIGLILMLVMGAHFGIGGKPATFAYEATMPGLGEEFVYRGVFLMLLNEAFGRPWKLAGIQFGWGFIIVTAMFGFLHGIDVKPGSTPLVHFYWSGMIFPAIIGVLLAWLRERSGSVWPGVVFHNFVNVLNHLLV
jgi:membrane protease YdiL (CAAX protease family)